MEDLESICRNLDDRVSEKRIEAVRSLGSMIQQGQLRRHATEEVNNHVHSCYSFSPYTPTGLVFLAWQAGLSAVGLVDHESIAAAPEFLLASRILGIAPTVGLEFRASVADSPFAERRINSPDLPGKLYFLFHGIPEAAFPALENFLRPIQASRLRRTEGMVEKLNAHLQSLSLKELDFHQDVLIHSYVSEGGSITERHILYALAHSLTEQFGRGDALITFLESHITKLNKIPENIKTYLGTANNPHHAYDLLGLLKQSILPKCFLPPDDVECPPLRTLIAFAEEIGAIPVYPYLGDITSTTADKSADNFEDSFLDELLYYLHDAGIRGIAYMPPRNTAAQMKRIQRLCLQHGFMEISGVDINSPRQSFHCPQVLRSDCKHLIDATWALVAHEWLVKQEMRFGLFSPQNKLPFEHFQDKLYYYSYIGRKLYEEHKLPALARDM